MGIEGLGQSVNINIELCIGGQVGGRSGAVLVSFDPNYFLRRDVGEVSFDSHVNVHVMEPEVCQVSPLDSVAPLDSFKVVTNVADRVVIGGKGDGGLCVGKEEVRSKYASRLHAVRRESGIMATIATGLCQHGVIRGRVNNFPSKTAMIGGGAVRSLAQ